MLHLEDSIASFTAMNAVLTSILSALILSFRSRLALQAEIALRHQLNVQPPDKGTFLEIARVGGLHHRYERRPA
jgi:hypothetical protein